jgi:hypothetical protein
MFHPKKKSKSAKTSRHLSRKQLVLMSSSPNMQEEGSILL